MNNLQIINDTDLASIDGSGWKAMLVIDVAFAICPPLGLGIAVGYFINGGSIN